MYFFKSIQQYNLVKKILKWRIITEGRTLNSIRQVYVTKLNVNLSREESNLRFLSAERSFRNDRFCIKSWQLLWPMFQTKNVLYSLELSYDLLNVYKSLLLPVSKLMPVKWLWLVSLQIVLKILYFFSNNRTPICLYIEAQHHIPKIGKNLVGICWFEFKMANSRRSSCVLFRHRIFVYTEADNKQMVEGG